MHKRNILELFGAHTFRTHTNNISNTFCREFLISKKSSKLMLLRIEAKISLPNSAVKMVIFEELPFLPLFHHKFSISIKTPVNNIILSA